MENTEMMVNGKFNFKNAKLNTLSGKIAKIEKSMTGNTRELSKLLGEILDSKCYEEDGFKSLAEYAEKTFGMKKALSYQLAKVGSRFYLSENATAKEVANLLPASKLAEIAALSDDEIAEEMENGLADKTQAELREVAKSHKEKTTAVLPEYEANIRIVSGNTVMTLYYERVTVPEIATALENNYGFTLIEEKSFASGFVRMYVSGEGSFARADLVKVKKERAAKPKKSKFSREELLAMLAEMDK